jgi:hypothetical protein
MRVRYVLGWAAVLGALACGGSRAPGQDERGPLRLEGLVPVAPRTSVTEAWGTLEFAVANWGDTPRQARVVAYYPARPDVQYARDLWVPAHARVASWLSVGPAPESAATKSRELAYQLIDRTGGADRAVRGAEPERRPTRALSYYRREPTTALYLASLGNWDEEPEPLDDPESPEFESLRLVRCFRESRDLSERVSVARERHLPPAAEAFDGIDHFVLAGSRLAKDPPGQQALRRWVLNGGSLWVLLDRVDPEVVAPILGDGMQFRVVGRTGLTTTRLRRAVAGEAAAEVREHDRPVELVQVALSGAETVWFEANGWPAAFAQPLGHGRVLFTTLGARGWYRPRTPRDPRPKFQSAPDLPMSTEALQALAWRLHPDREAPELAVEELAPLLRAEVGYQVVGRRAAWAVLGAFVVGVLAVVLWLRRSRLPELIGLGAPAAAALAAGAFVAAGVHSRQAVPPTAAAVALVAVSPGSGEEHWRGLFAVYRPDSGPVELSARRGGRVDLDASGLEGSARLRVETDLDAWHWEGLSFPAGVRAGPFRSSGRTGVSAGARFGAAGLEGRLGAGGFRDPADALIQTRAGATFAARLNPDGSFRVGSGDALPPNQYLLGTVLTDRQQRRQELYRKLLAGAPAPNEDRLLVWMETGELPFEVPGAARKVGQALCTIPLRYEAAGEGPVTIPAGFTPFAAVIEGRTYPPKLENPQPIRTRLRFQLPEWEQPFAVERATLTARVHSPGRKVSVYGLEGERPALLKEQFAPTDPVRVEIADAKFLRADGDGGLYLELAVSERLGPDGREDPVKLTEPLLMWRVEELGLEVVGRRTAK